MGQDVSRLDFQSEVYLNIMQDFIFFFKCQNSHSKGIKSKMHTPQMTAKCKESAEVL